MLTKELETVELSEGARSWIGRAISIRWGISRGRDTYGYTTCSLRDDRGRRLVACNGGGYDMRGTVIGHWIAATFASELLQLRESYYGLTFHDPDYDPGKAVIGETVQDRTFGGGSEGKTVAEAEADGESMGLERYQAFYRASSPVPTERHRVPLLDGACGLSSMMKVLQAIGLDLKRVGETSKVEFHEVVKA